MSKVAGVRETARAIRALARIPQGAVGKASKKALQPILREAKANLKANRSYKRGVLYRSMAVRKLRGSSSLSQWVIAATGRGVSIAHLVEFGTAPHWQPRRGVLHPGARRKPFLEPAFDVHADAATKTMLEELTLEIILRARRVAYKGK